MACYPMEAKNAKDLIAAADNDLYNKKEKKS
jgi:hypothetical protein